MLHLIPLGGLGEIGLNAMVLACHGELLLIDAGVMFPTTGTPGVDVVVPDFSWLRQNAHQLRGILLTHGHEDHVGALPFLLAEAPAPVYGTRLTLGMVRLRLEELGLTAELREIEPRHPFRVGHHFTVEATRVTHTIPDSVGFIIRTPEGTVLHTGDFKLDPAPLDGQRTDLERWGEVGEEGVLCLLSDSTNSELLHETGSEHEVEHAFERLFPQATGRLIVCMFASHLHRIGLVLALAQRVGRRVALLGRSMVRNVELARQLGYLHVPDGVLISPEEAATLPASQLVVLSTGSQAEPRAGLSQLAAGEGPLRLAPGDLVLLSARAIPGNERAVTALVDQLLGRGAKVLYPSLEPGLHVSGHASQPQQRRVLELVRPRHFVPVHGELHHLHRHLATAREVGLAPERLLLATNGDMLSFERGHGRFSGSVPAGRVYRDRFSQNAVSLDTLQERQRLADTGLVVAAVVLERTSLSVVAGPQLTGQGLSPDELVVLPRVAEEARALLLQLPLSLRADDARVREELARAVRRALRQYTPRRPVVVPMVLKL
jgi:ribonuclease J